MAVSVRLSPAAVRARCSGALLHLHTRAALHALGLAQREAIEPLGSITGSVSVSAGGGESAETRDCAVSVWAAPPERVAHLNAEFRGVGDETDSDSDSGSDSDDSDDPQGRSVTTTDVLSFPTGVVVARELLEDAAWRERRRSRHIAERAAIAAIVGGDVRVYSPDDVDSGDEFGFREAAGGESDESAGGDLGQIVLDAERIAGDAAQLGLDFNVGYMPVVLTHGICHLIGYDHEDPADAALMAAREARALATLRDWQHRHLPTQLRARIPSHAHPLQALADEGMGAA
jgi:rRNA maturation RNase YbeY